MKESLLLKLDIISERYDELAALLSDQETIADPFYIVKAYKA